MSDIFILLTTAKEYFPIIAILGVFIEISPLKLNPVSYILTWVGRAINKEISSELKGVKSDIKHLAARVDENEIDRLRCEILDFGNSCRNGRRHYKDEFDNIIKSNEKYHSILDRLGLTNGVLDLEYGYIQKLYQKCLNDNDFL